MLLRGKEEETAKVLGELEEHHNNKCEIFDSRLENHDSKNQTELRELQRREIQVAHQDRGLGRFQAIIAYYAHEGGDSGWGISGANGNC